MIPTAVSWLDDPHPGRALHFAREVRSLELRSSWDRHSYAGLGGDVAVLAGQLRDVGVRSGDLVALSAPMARDLVAALFAVWWVGATVSVHPAPSLLMSGHDYAQHIRQLLEVSQPRVVVVDGTADDLYAGVAAQVAPEMRVVVPNLDHDGTAPRAQLGSNDLALVQFTSGSSGAPKGIAVTWANLEANLASIRGWLRYGDDDSMSSWLPPYHDMGLVGTVLSAMSVQLDGWYLRPEQFLRDPRRWLLPHASFGVTTSCAPAFGYAYLIKRVGPERIRDLDLSGVRALGIGAERLDGMALRQLIERLAPCGLSPTALVPAYGLAEATLGVAGKPKGAMPRAVELARSAGCYTPGSVAPVLREAMLDDPRVGEHWLAESGCVMPGVEVRIVGADGEILADGCLGEIEVVSPAIGTSYRTGGGTEPLPGSEGGCLRTGDMGFVRDGRLYVLGRLGDSAKVNGQILHAEEVESRLSTGAPVEIGRVTALLGAGVGGSLDLVVLIEAKTVPDGWASRARSLVAGLAGTNIATTLVQVRSGAVPRTSSGKPRRRVAWQQWLTGTLAGTVVESARGDTTTVAPPTAAFNGSTAPR